ncbi:MAG: hypothetical protein K2Q24_09855, partial [Chitinophagaceae bacterium]|nr:hypothetical protein [Chitinophagaceae bacterium]
PPKLLLNKNQEKKKSTKATLKTVTLMGATNSVFKLMKSRSGLACNTNIYDIRCCNLKICHLKINC